MDHQEIAKNTFKGFKNKKNQANKHKNGQTWKLSAENETAVIPKLKRNKKYVHG